MSDRLNALGQYIIEQTKRNFNFKQIKNDPIYYNILFIRLQAKKQICRTGYHHTVLPFKNCIIFRFTAFNSVKRYVNKCVENVNNLLLLFTIYRYADSVMQIWIATFRG